jgi:hypothetical protein
MLLSLGSTFYEVPVILLSSSYSALLQLFYSPPVILLSSSYSALLQLFCSPPVILLSSTYSAFLYSFFLRTLFWSHNFEFINKFKNQFLLSDVMKTYLFLLELLHSDEWTDGQTWPTEQTNFESFLFANEL